VMRRVAVPVLASVTLWAALVVPIFWELKVRRVGEKLTVGERLTVEVKSGGELPPQAAQTAPITRMVANNKAAGRRCKRGKARSNAKASETIRSQIAPTGTRGPSEILRCKRGGVPAAPVVVMVSVLVTGEVLPTVTDVGEKVQLAPVGQPLATLR
jgi:hypothetical protein